MNAEELQTLDELNQLKRQVESAIATFERGELVPMDDAFRKRYDAMFGNYTYVIGDFYITKIK